jgi:hypothetical protein
MPQFMEQHADEEHDGRQCTDEPIQQRRPVQYSSCGQFLNSAG